MTRKHRIAQFTTAALIGVGFVITPAVAGPALAEKIPVAKVTVPTAEAHTSDSGTVWKCFDSGCGWYLWTRSGDVHPDRYIHDNIHRWSKIVGNGPDYVRRTIRHYVSW